ncbi:MAG TPA: hypothetical protein DDZ83_02245, partial [Nitrospinae bacterium]|nr:hypothetical protein [Nitrospinota bacterium]
ALLFAKRGSFGGGRFHGLIRHFQGEIFMPVEIEVYTTEPCTFCIAAKTLLKKRGLDYKEHLIFGNT